jgi:predicted transcriptional regulator
MSTKDQVIEKIKGIDNQSLLQEIMDLIDFETSEDSKIALPDEIKSKIDQGIKDVEEGRVYSDKDAKAFIEEWFQKRK